MTNAPVFDIDFTAFRQNPYPILEDMRRQAPIAYVPALDAVLVTKRDDIFTLEKRIGIFSSDQPEGLMTRLMGQNMMRKDGPAHQLERKAIFPTVSPKTVKNVWRACFQSATREIIDRLKTERKGDIVTDFAMPVSAQALKAMTGLTNMTWQEMDRVSQGMIDGCANYVGDAGIEAHCNDCTESIDWHISDRIRQGLPDDDMSLLTVQRQAGLSDEQIRANIKLAISGGQNEPRDAIAGIVWALLEYPDTLENLKMGEISHLQVFEEFTRWIAPIGMSPRRVTQIYKYKKIQFDPNDKVFLMFSSGNRDESIFDDPNQFNPYRDTSKSITFGAGPHFCAGAWASKSLIVDVAIPMLIESFPSLKLEGEVTFTGWAFRGPLTVPVDWRN
jgi:cytochrome P450